jgi:lipopolysaccharide/colanic/teichoic acid biosynthesis glycosyltransferase
MRSEIQAATVANSAVEFISTSARNALDVDVFKQMIAIERKRTERTMVPFLLMLLEIPNEEGQGENAKILDCILSALTASIRDTDLIGWYNEQAIVGAIFTGLVGCDKQLVTESIVSRISSILRSELTAEQFEAVTVSCHFFPDDWDHDKPSRQSNPTLYPDLLNGNRRRRPLLVLKRAIDIVGSVVLLLLCSPAFLAIALAVKMSSKGPVFFRQRRVGQYGRCFTFLKFRSMYVNNDNSVHKEFIKRLIANESGGDSSNGNNKQVYKLTNDKRVTPIGRFLRRSSLDELPQFLNVLWGDMSLVGPRPPIPYELETYQMWHRRRLLDVKPGITGLWQVMGRSSVKFDEMVRLDLRYATSWNLWLDLRILILTPLAVIKGSGAF